MQVAETSIYNLYRLSMQIAGSYAMLIKMAATSAAGLRR